MQRIPPKEGIDAAVEALRHAPEAVDLFALLRYVEASAPHQARLGYSNTPRDDAVRLGQYPSTIFAPTAVHSIEPRGRRAAPVVRVLSLGLFGPNGPLPLHITEYVRDRIRNQNDPTLVAFSDIFHHRLLSLFYRAWADAQPAVQMDRPGQNRFAVHAGSLSGLGFSSTRQRDSIADNAKLFATGHFVRLTRNPEGICQILSHYFQIPVRLHEHIRSWIDIPPEEQTSLTRATVSNQLGCGALAGARVPDVQSRFRLELGAMTLAKYEEFLPGARDNVRLRDWLRQYIGLEFKWDADLLLRADEVPQSQLG
ncbi:MAG: type VI secretion system baseplate subunit TssG, partial [Burkholderiaceae bacterium]|nr:type VI secretion system baseplate subunit TssG [Burkholderiaceae bacterium]